MQVFGPVLHDVPSPDKLNSSMRAFYDRVFKKEPHRKEYAADASWVDVRDVALGHVRALQVPDAGGKRIILSTECYVWQDWCTYLLIGPTIQDAHNQLSVDTVRDLDIPGLESQVGEPGAGKGYECKISFANTRAKTLLGMQFRDKTSTARDIVQDFISRGWILR